jgi:hypothetical protein
MTAAYFSAAIPEPYRILGLKLKPLSLGRYRLMRRFDVAFVSEESVMAKVGDLILGVLICSMRCDEFLAFLDSNDFRRDIAKWMAKASPLAFLGCLPWVGKWFARRNGFDLIEKILLFKRYIEVHSEVPKYWDLDGSGTESGAHWSHGIEVVLRGELGWSKEEIDEAPLSKAIADYFKWCENKGFMKLMTPWELEMIAKLESANGSRT